VAESVELTTVLMTDLVDSTRLAAALGPARADEVREEHFELLRVAISSCRGNEVKNLGDGLMIVFTSASAAVQCAVSMQQLAERRYRNSQRRLHMRIGLGAGESTVKEGDYFGMPVVEAARLCAQAPADGILVSAAVKLLAGRCEGVEFCSAGALELKGFADPVEAFAASWEPLGDEVEGAARWPLPPHMRTVPRAAYVGRSRERAVLADAQELARGGARQAVLISGEPGIGKTRLASFAAHQAHAKGMAVCWGCCSEELAVPYEPWIELCSQVVANASSQLLEEHVGRHGSELARVVRNLGERVGELPEQQSSDPETERYLLFAAVVGLLAEVAASVPLCVVLDDLHWADVQSVALLKHLLRSVESGALQLIITYRDSDLGKEHPLSSALADLRGSEGLRRIALRGLGADDVAQIMTAVAGHELEPDGVALAGQVAEETGGNPFFVGEILRGLSESGTLSFDPDSGRWSIDDAPGIVLPESIREVIERRVERLGKDSQEILRFASVIGRSFELELLARALGVDQDRLLDSLEAAVAAAVLSESGEQLGRFHFAHALVNQTLYERLGGTRRARMHQRVAEALEEQYGADPSEHLGELALHWRLAALSGDSAKAAGYALRAGERALERLAPDEAGRLFTDALGLAGSGHREQRCEALIGLGEAQRQIGDSAYRETLLEASRLASELADGALAARAALTNNRGITSVFGEVDEQRLGAIERAIELDDAPDSARRARLLALQAMELAWDDDFARRRALADEAVALARSAQDPRAIIEVLHLVLYAYRTGEMLELRTALAEELLERASSLQDPALHFWVHDDELHVRAERGEFARVRAALAREQEIAQELGQPTLSWNAAYTAAGFELMCGDMHAGEREMERALQVGQEAGQPDAGLIYGSQLCFARTYQGRLEEIIEMLEQSVRAFPGVHAFGAGFAAILCWLERRSEAAAILERAAGDRFESVSPNAAQATTLALYAEAASQTGNVAAAAILHARLEVFANQVVWNGSTGYGHARLYLGLLAATLGRSDEADAHLLFACEFHEANRLQPFLARGHAGWAQALLDRGDVDRAREHAARALELSREHGYGLFEEPLSALLQGHTGSPA